MLSCSLDIPFSLVTSLQPIKNEVKEEIIHMICIMSDVIDYLFISIQMKNHMYLIILNLTQMTNGFLQVRIYLDINLMCLS